MIDSNLPNKVLWKVSEFAWFHSLHLNTFYLTLEYVSLFFTCDVSVTKQIIDSD